MKCINDQQISELTKSVIGRGEWLLLEDYSFLHLPEKKWFTMTEQSREAHIKKLLSCPVTVLHTNLDSGDCNSPLAVPVEKCRLFHSSTSMAENIWKKAEELIKSNGIASAPWDEQIYLVKSFSSTQPHTVKCSSHSGGLFKFSCDDKCQMFQGFSICSHVVSTAQYASKLLSFIEYFNSVITGSDLSAIAYSDLPSGSGRKGGIPKRKRKKKITQIESSSISPHLQSASSFTAPSTPVSISGNVTGAAVVNVSSGGVFTVSSQPVPTCTSSSSFTCASSQCTSSADVSPNFVLKFKTNLLKVCQSCRKNYDGVNDTMGLVAARAERKVIYNTTTGAQFLSRESNSHYHVHIRCLKLADANFEIGKLTIPSDVKACLNPLQKFYLASCINIPFESLTGP